MIREIESTNSPGEKTRARSFFASSPDRGLLNLLKIFRRAASGFMTLSWWWRMGSTISIRLSRPTHRPASVRRLHEAILKEMNQPG